MRNKKDKVVFKNRTFLNDDASMSAFVIAVVEEFEDLNGICGYPTLDIADCTNKVSLDFSFYNKGQMKKSRKKLEKFLVAVNGFAKAFDDEMRRVEGLKEGNSPIKKKTKRGVI